MQRNSLTPGKMGASLLQVYKQRLGIYVWNDQGIHSQGRRPPRRPFQSHISFFSKRYLLFKLKAVDKNLQFKNDPSFL